MKVLITGGCGFIGSNLAAEAISRGLDLLIFDSLSRPGSEKNLEWLRSLHDFTFYQSDVRKAGDLEEVMKREKPNLCFHLAGQVAMTTSISNPRLDFETNALGTFNVLEAARKYSPETIIVYSSTNKVYGDLDQYTYDEKESRYVCVEFPLGFNESIPLDFRSPYGCSKGCADQYVLDYSRMHGLGTVVLRHSSAYGGRQFATYDQGWVGWFCQKAIETRNDHAKQPFTISGNGKQVRDVLYASDIAALYFTVAEKIETTNGEAYNIGGGIENSLSLLELFGILEKKLKIEMLFDRLPWRESDQKVFVADLAKIKRHTGWFPVVSAGNGVERTLQWLDGIAKS